MAFSVVNELCPPVKSVVMDRLHDADMRVALKDLVMSNYPPDGMVGVEELQVGKGNARIDLALIGEELHGFEIKSHSDTLTRLASQREYYNAVFDRLWLVLGGNHLDKATAELEPHWGIINVERHSGRYCIDFIREAQQNPLQCGMSLTELLWSEEARKTLTLNGAMPTPEPRRRRDLRQAIVENLEVDAIRRAVSYSLRNRDGWRSWQWS